MARQLKWYEKSNGFASLAAQGGVELLSPTQVTDIGRGTIERVILTRYLKNGSSANNVIHEGLIVAPVEAAVTDYVSVRDDAKAEAGWLWKSFHGFDVADTRTSAMNLPATVDIRVRRKFRDGDVLEYLVDDEDNDFDLIGMHARILVRLA